MLRKMMLLSLLLPAVMLFTACTPSAATPDVMMENGAPTADAMMTSATPTMETVMQATEPMMDGATPTASAMMDDAMSTPTGDAMMQPTGSMMNTPESPMGQSVPSTGMNDAMMTAWTAIELTDPASDQMFKINDFEGKVVLLETFAQWCPTCKAQQQEVVKLHEMMGMNSDLVSVSLDIDPNEDAAMLKAYLEKHGFDWYFAVAPAEVSREISQTYGIQFLNPSSAPMLIIDREGEAHTLPFGLKSAEDLQKALEPYL